MIKVPVLGKPLQAPLIPPPPEPPEPMFPPEVIKKAQGIYSSKYANTQPGGKTAPVQGAPPTAIPATGKWGTGQ